MNLRDVPVEWNITRHQFQHKYAHSRIPVIVKGATKNWKAMDTFSLDYFRDLYNSYPDSAEVQDSSAMFFGYKTEFLSLLEALNMESARRKKPWYFGWFASFIAG